MARCSAAPGSSSPARAASVACSAAICARRACSPLPAFWRWTAWSSAWPTISHGKAARRGLAPRRPDPRRPEIHRDQHRARRYNSQQLAGRKMVGRAAVLQCARLAQWTDAATLRYPPTHLASGYRGDAAGVPRSVARGRNVCCYPQERKLELNLEMNLLFEVEQLATQGGEAGADNLTAVCRCDQQPHAAVLQRLCARPARCPLYPQKRTSRRVIGMSAFCQKRTFGLLIQSPRRRSPVSSLAHPRQGLWPS